MKAIFSKKEILGKLNKSLGIVSPKMDILNGFILNVSADNPYIYMTDTETAIREKIQCTVLSEGIACIPAKKFYEIVKEMPEEMEISLNDNWLEILADKTNIRLATYSANDYPVWQEQQYDNTLEFSTKTLTSMIDKTIFATGDSDARYILNGILFHFMPNLLTMVGTDGHRMSTVKNQIVSDLERKLVISKKSLALLKKFLAEDVDMVNMYIGKSYVKFQTQTAEIMIRLLEGNFPNYEAVIPTQNDKTAIVNKDEFVSLVKRVSLIGDDKAVYPIVLSFKNNFVEMYCKLPEVGEAKAGTSIEYNAEDFVIGFNPKYLSEAIANASADSVTLNMLDADKAVVIKENGDSPSEMIYTHIIMPIRL